LTAVLQPRTGETDVGFFVANGAVDRPPEERERSRTDLAFHPRFFFDHLNVRVLAETGFAHGRKIGGFAAGTIDVGLGRHDSGEGVRSCGLVVMGWLWRFITLDVFAYLTVLTRVTTSDCILLGNLTGLEVHT